MFGGSFLHDTLHTVDASQLQVSIRLLRFFVLDNFTEVLSTLCARVDSRQDIHLQVSIVTIAA